MNLRILSHGINSEELVGFSSVIREEAIAFGHTKDILLDTCGTGGDNISTYIDNCESTGVRAGTVNVSTAAAIVAATSGIPVAKHGNYSLSSMSGSANLLLAFGYQIPKDQSSVLQQAKTSLDKTNFAFLLAPHFHPALIHFKQAREELANQGIRRTIMNILGPLSNPAYPSAQSLGAYDPRLTRPIVHALKDLGTERALVFHCGGLDEMANHAQTTGYSLEKGKIIYFSVSPEQAGYTKGRVKDLIVNSPEESARELGAVLSGEGKEEIKRFVTRNAAAAIYLGKKISATQALREAKSIISSGESYRKLIQIVEESKKFI
jgi:anthranilate phosphoribosyltransferase